MNQQMEKIGMMLELFKVKVEDSGVYVCQVQNSVGTNTKTISLSVKNWNLIFQQYNEVIS